jgi:hypothetical protein
MELEHTNANEFRLLIVEDRVSARVSACRICGGKSGNGMAFLRVLQFSPININPQ